MNFLKKYFLYVKDNPEGFWFKRKLFGWGWTPATWQGWVITGLYIVVVLMAALTINENSPREEVFFTFLMPLFFFTVVFMRIAYKKGEKPKWSWGFPKKK